MGIFDLFKSKPKSNLTDFSAIGADMHSHLIPGIDDGSKSIEDSIQLIKGLSNLGYKKLITTPHIMSDYYQNTPDIILSGLDAVRNALEKEKIDIRIDAAAEYYLDADFEKKLKAKNILTFGDNYILFEVSYLNEPEGVRNAIFNMQMGGYKPIMAHPERYPFWYSKKEKYHELADAGALLQLNINSLSGHYGPGALKTSEYLLENNLIRFLGSDCHHQGHLKIMEKSLDSFSLSNYVTSGNLLNTNL